MAIYSMDQTEYWVPHPGTSGEPVKSKDILQSADMRSSHRLLGEGMSAPRVAVLDLKPGGVIWRHYHDCERFEMIVKGSLYVGDDELQVGTVIVSHAGEVYGPKIAGPQGCVTVEVFAQNDLSTPIYELDDGSFVTIDSASGMTLPTNLAQKDWVEERRRAAMEAAAVSSS